MKIFVAVWTKQIVLHKKWLWWHLGCHSLKKTQTENKKNTSRPNPFVLLTPDTALFTGFAEKEFL